MFKNTLLLVTLLFSFSTFASPDRYTLVIFHGLGGYEAKNLDEAQNIPENLSAIGVEKMYNAGHGVNKRKFKKVLENFECKNGQQMKDDMGLIIIGYSWGARKSYEFSKNYFKKCGQKADRAYMIDGIQKLITSFRHAPVAKYCKNFFKNKGIIGGMALKDCENFDKTEICERTSGMQCHQQVLKEGFRLTMEDLETL